MLYALAFQHSQHIMGNITRQQDVSKHCYSQFVAFIIACLGCTGDMRRGTFMALAVRARSALTTRKAHARLSATSSAARAPTSQVGIDLAYSMIEAAIAGGTILGSGVTSGSSRLLCPLAASLRRVRLDFSVRGSIGIKHLLWELAKFGACSRIAEQPR